MLGIILSLLLQTNASASVQVQMNLSPVTTEIDKEIGLLKLGDSHQFAQTVQDVSSFVVDFSSKNKLNLNDVLNNLVDIYISRKEVLEQSEVCTLGNLTDKCIENVWEVTRNETTHYILNLVISKNMVELIL